MENQTLTEATIPAFQAEFGLSYHVRWCFDCQQKVGFEGKDVLEVGGSLPKDFVLGGLKAKSWTAIEGIEFYGELPETGQVIGGDIRSRAPITFDQVNQGAALPEDYGLVLGNIEDLPEAMHNRYDLIFSVAAFEHIPRMTKGLMKMYQALKPGGMLYALASPIWSCRTGHHHPVITGPDGTQYTFNDSPIPNHAHLLLSPPEMAKYLMENKGLPAEVADEMVYYVYHSPQINRLFTEDYVQYAQQSPFTIKELTLTGQGIMKPEVQQLLESRYPNRKYFNNAGVLLVMEKPLSD